MSSTYIPVPLVPEVVVSKEKWAIVRPRPPVESMIDADLLAPWLANKGEFMDFKPVRKAVFPVGGLGTRFLPATNTIPKEMLTVVDKPLIKYAEEETIEAGIEQINIVTGRAQSALDDQLD